MAENDKDNKDFEFIKEQVIEKKRKKIKKRLLSVLMTLILAILFGLVAAVTFAIAEPGLYDFLNKEGETKTPVSFPTPSPEIPTPTVATVPGNLAEGNDPTEGGDKDDPEVTQAPDVTQVPDVTQAPDMTQVQPHKVIERVYANIEDYIKMSDEIRSVAYDVNKSIVTVSSSFTVVDWFDKSVDKTVETTGVIISDNNADFLVLVSLDRVQDANSIRIKFTDTTYVDAVIQDYVSDINLAVLSVAKVDIPQQFITELKVAKPGESYSISIGNPVIALGSPNGHVNSMDIGIITSKGSWISITDNKLDLFNTDIVNNSNSDGIIINLKGEIIGLITRKLKEDINEDLSTAICISKVQPYIAGMVYQSPRIYFGIVAEDMTEAAKQDHSITNGIYVSEVQPDSPAYDAGIKSGDIIEYIDSQAIFNTNGFFNYISTYQPDTEITVKVKRTSGTSDKDMEMKVTLTEKKK